MDAKRYWKEMDDKIARAGYAVQAVLSDGTAPPYSYTIGLAEKGEAEIAISGLGPNTAWTILTLIVEKTREGLVLADGLRIPEIIQNYDVVVREAEPSRVASHARGAVVRAGPRDFDLFQIVFPDVDGRFPWEEGCQAHIGAIQATFIDPRIAPPVPVDGLTPPR